MPDKVAVSREKLDSLADVIGAKSERGVPLTFEAMEDAVLGIETGIVPTGTLAISENGTHDVAKYAQASVNVEPKLQSKTVHPTDHIQTVMPSSGYDGFYSVSVEGIDLYDAAVVPSTETQVVEPVQKGFVIWSEESQERSASTTSHTVGFNIADDIAEMADDIEATISFSITGYSQSAGMSASVEDTFTLSSGFTFNDADKNHYLGSVAVYPQGGNYYELSFRTNYQGYESWQFSITCDLQHDALSSVTVAPIPSEYVIPTGTKSISANGTGIDVAQYASVDVAVPTGGGGGGDSGDRSDPIRFFDYDGTLVASYTSVPSSMPDVPTHDRLTNGTWNYTLAQVAEQFDAMGTCDVGANYDTASGATEIDVTLDSDHLEPYLCVAVNGTVTVDWGDGGATDTVTGTSWTVLIPTRHVYAAAGSYTISIDGDVAFYSGASNYPAVMRGHDITSNSRQYDREYCYCVTAIRVADGSRLGSNAFNNCSALQAVSIPAGVTSIDNHAFYDCYSLQAVSIPASVTSIGNYAFQNCYALQAVSIPAGVTSIGTYAFQNCYALQAVSIPASVTSIGTYMFNRCASLQAVSIPAGVKSIGTYAFNECYSMQTVSIPASVTSIGSNAFQNCYALQAVSIPAGVKSIGTYAFNNCYALQAVNIPAGVTKINSNVFYDCYSLQTVSIPASVTSISNYAFYNCYGTNEYHLERTTPPTLLNTNVFNGIVAGTVIYVPQGCLEAYQTASNWSKYASYMQEEAS